MTRCERHVQYVWFIYLDKWNHCQLILPKKKVPMSPPREQMQFVSNLILSQLVFPLVPHRSIWTAAERGLLLSYVICLFSYRTTDVSQNIQLCVVLVLEKTNWKTRKDLIMAAEYALNKVGHFQWQVTFWPCAPEGMQGVPPLVPAKRKIFHHVTDLSNYFLQPKKNGGDKVIKHSTELWPPSSGSKWSLMLF